MSTPYIKDNTSKWAELQDIKTAITGSITPEQLAKAIKDAAEMLRKLPSKHPSTGKCLQLCLEADQNISEKLQTPTVTQAPTKGMR